MRRAIDDGTGLLIAVDVGGTFTDVVVATEDGRTSIHKAFTVSNDESQGVFGALERAAQAYDLSLAQLLERTKRFVHGSTVAANALLERKGARTAFVTTEGFRDTLVMRRMFRENMYDLRARVPENILAREAILQVPERIDRGGAVVRPLEEAAVGELVERLAELDVEAVGISLLFSFRNPEHEHRLRDAIATELPNLYVAASADVAPEIRDYERASTTLLCAYLGPRAATYLFELERRLVDDGLTCGVQIMRSNGGVCSVEQAVGRPTDLLLSGPAGGVVAAMGSEELSGEPDLISFDMGGTSCDISVVRGGRAVSSTFLPRHSRFEGWDVLTPFLDIHALGSGGGSIVWRDRASGLHVGPRSAGSSPGPACYGRGGEQPTVTDANLCLGYLNPDYFLDRELELDRDAAAQALLGVAEPLGMTVAELSGGVFDIAGAAMADRVRVVLADRGYDPRDFTLLCYGGAGGIHAPAVIEDLGIGRAIVPRDAAAFSAAGFLQSDEQHDFVHTVARPLARVSPDDLVAAFGSMRDAAAEVGAGGHVNGSWSFEHQAEMRYDGQTHDIRVPLGASTATPEQVRAGYEQEYEQAYGYLNDPALIQLINLRLTAIRHTARPFAAPVSAEAAGDVAEPRDRRPAFFAELDGWTETRIYDGLGLQPGQSCEGPAIVELPTTTIVVRPRQALRVDHYRNFVVESRGE